MLTIERVNLGIFLTICFFVFFFVIFNNPYYLEHAATDSGFDYTSDALSIFIGEGQSHYNHPGLIPVWIGSFVIKFFLNENFNIQSFINTMSVISYLLLMFSFYFLINIYKDSNFKSVIIFPICLTCFLWPPFVGSLTSFSSYSFLPAFTILFLVNFFQILFYEKRSLIYFVSLSFLSLVLLTTHVITILLIFFAYLFLFFKLIKENKKKNLLFFIISLFAIILVLFLLFYIEPKIILSYIRMLIRFFTTFSYSLLGYTIDSKLAKAVYFFINFKIFFISLFFLLFLSFYFLIHSKQRIFNKKISVYPVLFSFFLLSLFIFHIIFVTSDFFIQFDKNFYTFKITPNFYHKDFDYTFNASKLNSFTGVFLIFIFLSLYEKDEKKKDNIFQKRNLLKVFLLLFYLVIICSILDTNKKLQKNYSVLESFFNDSSEFINKTIPNSNFVAHDLPSKYNWWGPNTVNFSKGSSEEIKFFFKRNYKELQLAPMDLQKIKEISKASQDSIFNRYYQILCNERYDLLRKPNNLYKIIGNIFNILQRFDSKICNNALNLFINLEDYTISQFKEFIFGERFGLKAEYILKKKKDYKFYFYDLETNNFYTKIFTSNEFLNEIDKIYGVEKYKTVKFKNSDYIVIKLK